MRLFILLTVQLFILLNYFSAYSLASYETPYGQGVGVQLSPIPAASSGGGQGWGQGQAAGSYYHYHVPLVGQQSHYSHQPASSSTDLHHHLLWLLPLLLLLIAPLAFLPLLLKLLLAPVALSFLALLLPLLMMGGMMMMMMMGGGMMMMPMRNQPHTSVSTARAIGQLLMNDWTHVVSTVSRSIDFDDCPEKFACQLGSLIFPSNSTGDNSSGQQGQGELISKYIVEQLLPRGKVKKVLRQYKNAFWAGSKQQTCDQFQCQPKFRSFSQQDSSNEKSSSPPVANQGDQKLESNDSINTVESPPKYQNVYNHTLTTFT